MNRTDVQDTLQEMWQTRPTRPREDRQVAGVATAIAHRYDIDPVLVRVGFVVAAFTGIGALLYVAGWIALPEAAADPAAPTRPRRPRTIMVIGLGIAAALSIGTVFGGDHGGFVLPALVALGLLFLLHRTRGGRVAGLTAARSATDGPSLVKSGPPDAADHGAGPPAWDPLGAAPFAWDLPEPTPLPVPGTPGRRRLPVTSVTLGAALLAGAATAVILLSIGTLTLATLPLLFGVVLAVVGAGLVVGAFLRSGRGLIPIAVLLGVLTWSAATAPLDRWAGDGFGDINVAPTTVGQLEPSYRRTAGDISLDLRRLDLSTTAGGNTSQVPTTASVGAGDVTVLVAPDTDVTVTAAAGVGTATFGDREVSDPGARLAVTDLGADGVRSGRALVLDLSTGAGDVEVRRG